MVKFFVYLQDIPLKLGYSCLPRKNWGLYLGIVARVVIIVAFLWTFMNIDNLYIERKGLVIRNLIWLVLSLALPLLAWRRRIPLSQYPFRTDALLITPLAVDMGANMVAGSSDTWYLYWNWGDKVAHFWGSGIVAFFIFLLMASRNHYHNNQPSYRSTILVSLALSGIWELYEYLSDVICGTEVFVDGWLPGGLQLSRWQDAVADLSFGFLGILLCVYLCQRWYKMIPQPEREILRGNRASVLSKIRHYEQRAQLLASFNRFS